MFNLELFDICLAVYPWYFLLVIEYEMMITFLLHTNHISKYTNHVSWQNMYVKYFVYWCQISLCLVFFFSRISLKGPNQARTFVSCYLTLDDVCLLTIYNNNRNKKELYFIFTSLYHLNGGNMRICNVGVCYALYFQYFKVSSLISTPL